MLSDDELSALDTLGLDEEPEIPDAPKLSEDELNAIGGMTEDPETTNANMSVAAKSMEGVDSWKHAQAYDKAVEYGVDTNTIINAKEDFSKPFVFDKVGKITGKFLTDNRGNSIYSVADKFNFLEEQYRTKQQRDLATHTTSFGTGDNLSYAQLGIREAKLQRQKIQPLRNQFWGSGAPKDEMEINNSNTQLSMLREPEGLFEDVVAASSGEIYDMGADIEESKYGLAAAAAIKMLTPAGKGWTLLSTLAGAGTMTAVGAEQEMLYYYEELSRMKDQNGKTLDNDIARGVSAFYGATSGLLENIPALRAFNRAVPEINVFGKFTKQNFKDKLKQPSVRAAFKKFGKNFTQGMTEEAFTEVFQQLTQDLSTNAVLTATGGEYDWDEKDFNTINELSDNMVSAGVEALKGSVGIMGGITGVGLKRDIRRARESIERLDSKDAIYAAGNNEDIKKTGTVGKEFSSETMHDANSEGNYIAPEHIEKFFQDAGLTEEEVQDKFPLTANAIYESKELDDGAEINIPDHEFQQFAESELETAKEIMNNYRESSDGLTRAEAIQLNNEINESLEGEPEKSAIFEDVYEQLKKIGATDYVARQQALLWDAKIRQRAKRYNISPEDMYEQSKLDLNEEDMRQVNTQDNYERLDSLLDMIRKGKQPTSKQAYGASIMEFLAAEGGLQDEGGELAGRDVAKKLIKETGITLDESIERLVEQGYFGGESGDYAHQDVLNAIDEEMAGTPVYAEDQRTDDAVLKEELDYIEDTLNRMGVNTADMTNQQIKDEMERATLFQDAYHGTAVKDIEQFLTEYINTGEGAQAYGWGLYFASDKGIAEFYRDALQDSSMSINGKGIPNQSGGSIDIDSLTNEMESLGIPDKFSHKVALMLSRTKDKQSVIDEVNSTYGESLPELTKEFTDILSSIDMDIDTTGSGQTYKVDLKPKEDEYLLWDKPLSEQSEKVKQAVIAKGDGWAIDNETGQSYYQKITDFNTSAPDEAWMVDKGEGQRLASAELLNSGIRGVKYKDAASRLKGTDDSFNFVIFDDADVDITDTFYQDADEKNLIVQHNLTAQNLLHAEKMGGIAPPSLGISRKEHPLEGFGEITLIADKSLLEDPKAKTYNTDAYTPRYPNVSYDVDYKKYYKKEEVMNKQLERADIDKRIPSSSDIEERGLDKAFSHNDGARYLYLDSIGKAPRIPMEKIEWKYSNKLKKFIGRNNFELEQDPNFVKTLTESYKEKFNDDDRLQRILNDEGVLSNGVISSAARSISRYVPKQVDRFKFAQMVQKKVGGDSGYNKWVHENFADTIKQEKIFTGFTPAGKRKYIPHTLENVSKLMTKTVKDGENFSYGVGSIRAVASKQFKSVKSIQGDRDKIVPEDKITEIKEESENTLYDLVEALKPYYKYEADGYRYNDAAAENMKEMVTTGSLQDFDNVPDELKKEIAEFLVMLRNMPAGYFESKMQRPMGIGEFDTAIVPTGKEYNDAIEVLKNNGVKVRRYQPKKEGDRIRAVNQSKKLFFQKDKGAKGYYERTPLRDVFKITLTGKADLSTFIHESGHAFLDMMIQDAAQFDDAKEELDVLMKWMGVTSPDQIKTPQHEQFARGFEAYLREGKAPTAELKEAFRNFKLWLKNIYKQMRQLNVELTPEVTGVMNRMFADQEEIDRARNDAGILPMFDDLNQVNNLGMSRENYEQYRETYNNTMQSNLEKLDAARLTEYNKQIQFMNKERTDKAKLQAEINLSDKYRAYLAITNKLEMPDVKRMDGESVYSYAGKNRKLSKESVQRVFPEIPVDRLRGMYDAQGNGIDADMLANNLNFKDGVELVTGLANQPPYKDALAAETAKILKDEYGVTDIVPTAKEVVHNDDTTDFIKAELKTLGKRDGVARQLSLTAKEIIAKTTLSGIKPIAYERAERKASTAAARALAAGDKVTAAREKQRQLLNHYLFKYASKALTEADKQYRYLKKFDSKTKRKNVGLAGEQYLSAIDTILEDVQIKQVTNKYINRRQNLQRYIQKMHDEGAPVDENLIAKLTSKNYRELTTEEFNNIYQMVKNIDNVARTKKKWLDANSKRTFDEVAGAITNSIITSKVKLSDKKNIVNKVRSWIRAGDAELVKMEFLTRWMDGGQIGGVVWENLFKPFQTAEEQEMAMNLEYTKKVIKIINEREWGGTVMFMGNTMDKTEVVAAALNIGNDGNLQRLLDGYGWNYAQLAQELEAQLTKDDWNAIQEIWDTIDELYKPMSDVAQRVEGERPAKVEAAPFKMHGKTYSGGYYPAVYDPEKSSIGEAQELNIGAKGFITSTVKGSAAQKRAEKVYGAISLELKQLPKHVHETIFYITHYEAVSNTYKTLIDSRVKGAIVDFYGNEYYSAAKKWLDAIATQGNIYQNKGWWDNKFDWLRGATSIGAMGYSITTALVQPLGLFNTVNELGAYNTTMAIGKIMKNPAKQWKSLNAQYPEFRNLVNLFDRDMKKQIDREVNQNKVMKKYSAFTRNAFWHIGMIQKVVNMITYTAAMNKYMNDDSLTKNQVDDKVKAAVRQTQSMAGQKDLANVQNSPIMRIFTLFYSYFSVLYAQGRTSTRNLKNMDDVMNAARMYTLLFVLPSIADTWFRDICEEEDEEAACYLRQVGMYMSAPVPLVRDVISALFSKYSYKVTPIEQTIANAGNLMKDIKEGNDLEIDKVAKTVLPLFHFPQKAFTQPWNMFQSETDEWREWLQLKKAE